VKIAASLFLVGVVLFAIAYFFLTILPMAIDKFAFSSGQTYESFTELMTEFTRDRENNKVYLVMVFVAIFSFLSFLMGLLSSFFVVIYL
jgi:hypothetical protein